MMKILCDFDGTTAVNDVGNLFFRTFADGRCHEIVQSWKSGAINSKECLLRECAISRVTRAQFAAFADSQKMDPHFPGFVDYCKSRGFPVSIASDGLDFYIQRVLKNHKLDGDVAFYSNHLVFTSEESITAEFPYFESGCGVCGNCKGFHVQEARKDGSQVVYVGDGLSDRCGALKADIVFAKRGRDLLPFCRENRIQHLEYDDFGDVLLEIKRLTIHSRAGS